MIGPVQKTVNNCAPQFIEGASPTTTKITAAALAIFAGLASFVFLPAELAIGVSLVSTALLSMCCCSPSRDGNQPRFAVWRSFVNAVPAFFNAAPLRSAAVVHHVPEPGHRFGPRPDVGGGHQQRPALGRFAPDGAEAARARAVHAAHQHGGAPGGPAHRVPVAHR